MRAIPVFLAVLVLAFAGLTSCVLEGGGSSDSAITGSVTVANAADWADLQIGVFYASAVDTDPNYFWYFDTDHELNPTEYIYRAGYWNGNDKSMHAFAPEPVSVSASQKSGVSGTFRAQLPETPLQEGYYHIIAWLDSDGDGLLDLVDSVEDADQIAFSEFNRCTRYDGGAYYVSNFYYTLDLGYQFGGFDGTGSHTATLSEANATDFSFDLRPAASGW